VAALRFDGFIESLYADRTGQSVREGQPLFRVYSAQVQQAQVDLAFALHASNLDVGSDEWETCLASSEEW
jgi:Cu(I)/Ag(I) efflux system membrane fusion protein